MRWILATLLLLCAGHASAATIDIKIYDAFGSSYSTTNIADRLGAVYDISFDPTLVITLGPSQDDSRVQEQEKIVNGLDPDSTGVLLAIGTPTQNTYGQGFSLTPNAAKELLPSDDAFRVLVLGAGGEVLLDSSDVVSRDRLLELAPKQAQ
jgi:hypothetical protein